jgi:prepilin-type N-terminal cleavage/methylation domain-containing protein
MKIKAFTISELIVALAISAIVTSVGYYAFRAIGQNVELKGNNLSQIENLDELRFLLRYDFYQNHDWVAQGKNSFNSESGFISYTFGSEEIIRSFNGKQTVFNFTSVQLSNFRIGSKDYILKLNQLGQEYNIVIQIHNNLKFAEESLQDY